MNTQDLIVAVNKWPDGPNINHFTPNGVSLAQYTHRQDILECDSNAHPWLFLHELAHAVGAEGRLARYHPTNSKNAAYAHEEVIAAEAATELCLRLSLSLDKFEAYTEYYALWWLDRAPPIRYNEVDEAVDYILGRFRHAP